MMENRLRIVAWAALGTAAIVGYSIDGWNGAFGALVAVPVIALAGLICLAFVGLVVCYVFATLMWLCGANDAFDDL